MRSEVFTIAKSVSDLIGPVGAETLLFRQIIKKYWKESSDSFVEDMISACFNFTTGEMRPEAADGIIAAYRVILGEDFISNVLPEIEMVIGSAYDKGRQYLMDRIMDGSISIKRVDSNIIENLMLITGSQKDSITRTIQRWFGTTQGAYFERFIVPETARLLSYAEDGEIENMRAIGERYKAFVEADGYWSAVSEYNVETSKVFSQVQLLEEMNITTYRIEAVLDEVTCDVCQWLHGTEWKVEDAVARMNAMIIAEEENVREINPFPSRQDPKEIEDPQESEYLLPPYHPRCRCGIVTTESSVFSPSKMPEAAAPIVPSDRGLNNVFNKYIHNATDDDLGVVLGRFPNLTPDLIRILTKAELKRVKKAYNAIPYSLRKWALGNSKDYTIMAVSQKTKISSRVIGNVIQINEKYLGTKYGPEVIMHELRHALINAQIIAKNGGARGAESIWDLLMVGKGKIKMPIHVNNMYKLNGGRGALAAHAGVDEFLAMMGDYYKPGMSFDQFVKAVRDIEVEKIQGSLSTIYANAVKWTEAEAKKAAQLWWDMVDVPNYTLMSKKQLLAKMGHKPANAAIQRIAYENETRLQNILRGVDVDASQLGDHEPFDVWIGGDAKKFYAGSKPFKKYMPEQVIEVKSIIRAKYDKITMHKPSLARKKDELKIFGDNTIGHTVVFDERTGKIYYRKGLGSFRLSAMQEVDEEDLIRIFGGKTKIVEAEGTIPVFRVKNIISQELLDPKTSGINPSYIIEAKVGPEGKVEKFLYKPVDEELWRMVDGAEELKGLSDSEIIYKYAAIGDKATNPYLLDFDIHLEDPIRDSIGNAKNAASLAQREALAAEVYKHLDYDGLGFGYTSIPETYLVKEGSKIKGVAVKWLNYAEDFDNYSAPNWSRRGILSEITTEEVYETLVFDYLIGNTDRHMHNMMRNTSNGRSILIDHGLTFPSARLARRDNGLSEFRSFVAHHGGIENLDATIGYREKAYFIEKLESLNTTELGKAFKLSKYEITAFEQRRLDLIDLIRMDQMEDYFSTYVDNANYMKMGGFDAKLMRSIHNHASVLDGAVEIELQVPPSLERKVNWVDRKTLPAIRKQFAKEFGFEMDIVETDDIVKMTQKQQIEVLNNVAKELERLNNDKGLAALWTVAEGADEADRWTEIGIARMAVTKDALVDQARVIGKYGYSDYILDTEYANGCFAYDVLGGRALFLSGMKSVRTTEVTERGRRYITKWMTRDFKHRKLNLGVSSEGVIPGNVGKNGVHILDHEIGHAVHDIIDEVLPDMHKEWFNLVESKGEEWIGKGVSAYAATSTEEAFAESFAAFVHPQYGKKIRGQRTRLPIPIEKYFKKLMKEIKNVSRADMF